MAGRHPGWEEIDGPTLMPVVNNLYEDARFVRAGPYAARQARRTRRRGHGRHQSNFTSPPPPAARSKAHCNWS
jgi:hypothetical protein